MKVKDLIDILKSYPKNADISIFYYDFYGENNCEIDASYNEYTNKAYLSPGDLIEE